MKVKKDNSIVLPIIILIIFILIAIFYSLFVYYYKNYYTNVENVGNRELTNEELKFLSDYLDNTKSYYLGMIFNSDMKINYDTNLLTDDHKQSFVIDYIKDNSSDVVFYDNGLYIDKNIFEDYYRLLFGNDDINVVNSNLGGEYDNDNFVYYNKENIKDGFLIDSIEIINSVYDGYNSMYSAIIKVNYNDELGEYLSKKSVDVVISYSVIDDFIFLNSFKVKSDGGSYE